MERRLRHNLRRSESCVYAVFASGRLPNQPEKRDEALRYALGLGCVDVLNVGCESITEVDDMVERIRKVEQRNA